jgi:3-methylfumaryl-CoA hydratase
MSQTLDITHLRQWIGREEVVTDHLSNSLVDKFRSTFGMLPAAAQNGDVAPRLIHFCLCQPAAPINVLGKDGHPARGGFLPPVPLPRRMWAGSDIAFSGDLLTGDTVTRRSTVIDVVAKEGRTGSLCFVTVDHEISGSNGVAAREMQTIVYRALEEAKPLPIFDPAPNGYFSAVIHPTPTLLFRYSALTFNGHRIHYDHPYATNVEGYPGLVVHGPLQATLLFELATKTNEGSPPNSFSFRSASALFDNDHFSLHAGQLKEGRLQMWSARTGGPIAMNAEAFWR